MLEMRYGIKIINKSGSIGLEDIQTIYGAAYNINRAFGGKLKEIAGNSSFYYTRRTDNGYGGEWEGGSIVSIGSTIDGQYPAENLIHEFGHLIDNVLFGGEAGNVLGRNTITDSNGNFVMGIRGDGKYDRQTGLGYFKSCSATASACQTEQHTRAWEPDGNTGSEEWADMFMNYVQGTMDMNSPAGVTRSLYVQIFLYPLIH